MASFDASKVRAVAIEIRDKAYLLYTDVLPILTACKGWTLNGLDPALPLPYDVKIQIDAFKSLSVDKLKLEPWVSAMQEAGINDVLTYPPPPVLGGKIQFESIAFTTLFF